MRRFPLISVLTILAGGPVAAQNTPQPAQHASNATISPDGRRIAFFSDRDGTGDYYVMNPDGSGVRRVTTDGGHRGRAYWDRDGSHLVFSRFAHDTTFIVSVPVGGGAAVEIGRVPGRAGAQLLGDGQRVLYGLGDWSTMQLVTSKLDGTGRMPLTAEPSAAFWCPATSPRGDLVAVTRKDAAGMQIWMMNLDGSNARALTRFNSTQGNPQCPAISADGRWVAAQAEVNVPGDSTRTLGHIWLIDATSGEGTRLAAHTAPYVDELPVWFPDGRRIAFQSDRTGQWEVYVMKVDGSEVKQLTR